MVLSARLSERIHFNDFPFRSIVRDIVVLPHTKHGYRPYVCTTAVTKPGRVAPTHTKYSDQ
jgi:hypothetical protein